MSWKKVLAFAVVVTLASQTLDILVHLLTNVAVHFGYVATKMAVIGFTLFFFSYWVGINKKMGIISSLVAAVMFYIYYRFAEPTLDRTVFVLDEDTWFILIHFAVILIPYWLTLKYIFTEASTLGIEMEKNRLYTIIFFGLLLGAAFTFPAAQYLTANNLMML